MTDIVKSGEYIVCEKSWDIDITQGKNYLVLAGGGDKDFVCGGKVFYDGFIIQNDKGEPTYKTFPESMQSYWGHSNGVADCTKESADILLKRFHQLTKAVAEDNLSEASFPLVGDEARIELISKRDTLQWVLEMLNIQEEK